MSTPTPSTEAGFILGVPSPRIRILGYQVYAQRGQWLKAFKPGPPGGRGADYIVQVSGAKATLHLLNKSGGMTGQSHEVDIEQ